MANIYVPGPSPVAIGSANGALSFLGWTEQGVSITEELRTMPVMADYAGPQMPADIMLCGKVATARFRLIDFNEDVLEQYVFARIGGGAPGVVQKSEIGTLIRAENGLETSLLRFCVKATRQPLVSIYVNNLAGCNFPACFIQGPIEFPFGNRPQVVPVEVYTWAMIDKTGQTGATLWNEDVSGFPATN